MRAQGEHGDSAGLQGVWHAPVHRHPGAGAWTGRGAARVSRQEGAAPRSRERRTVRDLAPAVAELASRSEQAQKIRLWTACNDLRRVRSMASLETYLAARAAEGIPAAAEERA
jgi:hypothetical protein